PARARRRSVARPRDHGTGVGADHDQLALEAHEVHAPVRDDALLLAGRQVVLPQARDHRREAARRRELAVGGDGRGHATTLRAATDTPTPARPPAPPVAPPAPPGRAPEPRRRAPACPGRPARAGRAPSGRSRRRGRTAARPPGRRPARRPPGRGTRTGTRTRARPAGRGTGPARAPGRTRPAPTWVRPR